MTLRLNGVFAEAPGVDFPLALVDGLMARFGSLPPERFARIEIYVNTRRMQRRIATLFDARGARLLPRLRLVTEAGALGVSDLPPPPSRLSRMFELARLVRPLVQKDTRLAPEIAVFELTRSLMRLLDEMQGEGVAPDLFRAIDAEDASEHWQKRKAFLDIVLTYLEHIDARAPEPELRQRIAISRLISGWREAPPENPVVVAGSTGSRGTTALLMEAVARLPTGAVVLPGFDREMKGDIWASLDDGPAAEDHPQFRFRKFLKSLDVAPDEVGEWSGHGPPSDDRNRLVSLALRPAPVTHQWMTEGPRLSGIDRAMSGVTMIEAQDPRIEATAIALRIRKALEDTQSVALITPDRMLTRRVEAALDRWGIVADDSAGEPLALSAPGRFLRHTAALLAGPPRLEDLLVVLKHPITCHGDDDARGRHLLNTRELELYLRRRGQPHVTDRQIGAWAETPGREGRLEWAAWLRGVLGMASLVPTGGVAGLVDHHVRFSEALAAGPDVNDNGRLWQREAGRRALSVMTELARLAPSDETLGIAEYESLLQGLLSDEEAREPRETTPGVMIWGTLEARVQGADLVILGSLNDGVWPSLPEPDPWLNRQMRGQAGLLLPDRQIGLSAHDFQQAIAAPEVVVTRALRDADAETVPSRWLNRLTNLLNGLPETGAPALEEARKRGRRWAAMAAALDPLPTTPNPVSRPSPRPPVTARPRSLSVTQIQTLIRDPYAIYAREILKLRPIDPLRPQPDARLRGTVMHDIFEAYLGEPLETDDEAAIARLMRQAEVTLEENALWPVARRLWLAGLARVAPGFIQDERRRQAGARIVKAEGRGLLTFSEIGFDLKAKADRIDLTADGQYVVYDYKTGRIPTPNVIEAFDKQLLLEAVMAEAGAFDGVPPAPVAYAAHIGLGSDPGEKRIELADDGEKGFRFSPASVRALFVELIRNWDDPARGYTARRAVEREAFTGDYDHLSRFGEWEQSDPAGAEDVG